MQFRVASWIAFLVLSAYCLLPTAHLPSVLPNLRNLRIWVRWLNCLVSCAHTMRLGRQVNLTVTLTAEPKPWANT